MLNSALEFVWHDIIKHIIFKLAKCGKWLQRKYYWLISRIGDITKHSRINDKSIVYCIAVVLDFLDIEHPCKFLMLLIFLELSAERIYTQHMEYCFRVSVLQYQ